MNNSVNNVVVDHCTNVSCSAVASSLIDSAIGAAPSQVSIAIGTDGFPMMAYSRGSSGQETLVFAKCNNVSCSSSATSTLDSQPSSGNHSSLAIGTDGNPVIVYTAPVSNQKMRVVTCSNTSCSAAASSTSNLTSTNANLSNYLDDAAYTNVGTSDNLYDSIVAGTSTRLAYLFTKKGTSNTLAIGATWEGQVSKATTTYLKIYNSSSTAWEVLNFSTSTTANTDFTLSGTSAGAPANYYDANTVAYFRIETGTTTASTTLKTDYITIGNPVLAQTAYIFLNDNGTTTDTYTQSHSAATSTAITNVKKGEKLVARIQIDNTGTATSTNQYRLQWENSDAVGVWNDLGTTTQIRWSLSEKAALPGRSGQVPLTTNQVGTCTTTTTFSSGLFVGGTATSTNLSLGPRSERAHV
jgi:hypothetical protein